MTKKKSDRPEQSGFNEPSLAFATPATMRPPRPINPTEEDIPSRNQKPTSDPPAMVLLPGYEFIEMLRRSERANVYHAHELESGLDVVIKQFSGKRRESYASEKKIQQFAQKNLPSAKEYFSLACKFVDDQLATVTKFMPGGDVSAFLARNRSVFKRLTPFQTGVIIPYTLDALSELHKLNIIHRDLKTSNLLLDINPHLPELTMKELTSYTDFTVKLCDWEFASFNQDLKDEEKIIGTPYYVAPELCLGLKADYRSDIYSAGVLLYYLLAGKYPFYGSNVTEVMRKHITDPVPDIWQFNEKITFGQKKVIEKALAKDPDKRYQAAEEFRRAWYEQL